VLAIKQLLEATEKYPDIELIENADADDLKSRIRNAIGKSQSTNELFFYFTGHGFQHETELFLCATNFDLTRPNQTGISTTDLHALLKLAGAEFVVKVLDACNSGSLLLKDGGILPQHKHGFRNFLQISSCLDTQSSLTGNPLSLFTEKFRDSQTPFFVTQYTGREQFVDDGKRLNRLRRELCQPAIAGEDQTQTEQLIVPTTRTLLDLLQTAESKVVKPEALETFVGGFFDILKKNLPTTDFAEYFDHEIAEHPDFREPTATEFITRVLSRENRLDNFVTASITRKRKRNPWDLGISSLVYGYGYSPDDYVETWDLELNCSMSRAQLKLTLTPKYANLQRIALVVTCAPSLEDCYVFEIVTQHLLRDFGKFDTEGREVVQRWYKFRWGDRTDGVAIKISTKLGEILRGHLEGAAKRLAKQ
jgi:hypothetical protein